MSFQPEVSIILPFRYSRGHLSEAVESVLSQEGHVSWELIAVNDDSDEYDSRTMEAFAAQLPQQLRMLSHPGGRNRGISASRNLGLEHARGEFIAFLDADDMLLSHKLQTQLELLRDHPSADMVYGPALRWWSWAGGIDTEVEAQVDGYGSDCLVPGEALLDTFLRDECFTPCTGSLMIRRSAVQRVGGFDEQFPGLYDDQVLYAKLCQESDVYVSSITVSKYRQHSQSCCGQAELLGTGKNVRRQFLRWLQEYRTSREAIDNELMLATR